MASASPWTSSGRPDKASGRRTPSVRPAGQRDQGSPTWRPESAWHEKCCPARHVDYQPNPLSSRRGRHLFPRDYSAERRCARAGWLRGPRAARPTRGSAAPRPQVVREQDALARGQRGQRGQRAASAHLVPASAGACRELRVRPLGSAAGRADRQDDFEAGRRLAARAKALLDAQLGALKTVAPDEQEDADKLDQVMLAADRAASTAPPLVSGAPAAAAAPPSPASSSAGARQGPSGDAVPAPKGSVVGRNGGPTLATLAIAGPDRRSRRSTRPTTS